MEGVLPVSLGGTDYLAGELNKFSAPPTPGDIYRVIGLADGVEVAIASGAPLLAGTPSCNLAGTTTLAAGEFCEVQAEGGVHFFSTNGLPFRVAQYMRSRSSTGLGDPSMLQLVPTSNMRCEQRFFSFGGFSAPPAKPNIGNFATIIAPTSSLGSTLLDGSPLSSGVTCIGFAPSVIAGTGFSWTECRLSAAAAGAEHVVEGLDPSNTIPVPLAVYAYGQAGTPAAVGAYSYPAGIGLP